MKNASIAKLAKTAGSPIRMQSTGDIIKNLNEVVANSNTGKGANVNFGTAFSNARKAGKKTFDYKGKSYTTETKEEKANRTADVGPTVRNAKNKVDLSKTIGTKNKKTDAKKTEAKKTTKPAAETKTTTKTKKKFRDTKLGKFLTTKRVKGAKKKTYNPRLNRFE